MHEHGYGAYRSAQHAGIARRDDSADVITSLTPVRFEVKRGKNSVHIWHKQVRDWIEKAKGETPQDKKWCIAWRPDRAGWYFILDETWDFPQESEIIISGFEDMLYRFDSQNEYTVDNPEEWIK